MQDPAITKTVVVAYDFGGEKKLVAYYTRKLKKLQTTSFSENLRLSLLDKLPAYMLPNLFIELDHFPTLPNGKIDKKSLPEPNKKSLSSEIPTLKPCDLIEEKLADIWSEVLCMDSVGINENFFLLGGHSINAVHILSRVNYFFAIDLPINIIFENNTIEKLANIIKKTDPSSKKPILTFNSTKKTKNLQLSPGQQRLFFLQSYENKSVYNLPFATILSGSLDIKALESSFKFLINRHQALRAYFTSRENDSVFHVKKSLLFDLKVEKLNRIDLEKTLTNEAAEPFDLNIPPLMRVRLFQVDKEEHVLMITVHHIISDGRSMDLLNQELGLCYAAYIHNEKPKLPPLKIQYLDFIAWQNSAMAQEKIQADLGYWKNKLADFSPLNMFTDLPRPAKKSHAGACYRFTVDKELVEKINTLSVKNNATLFMTVLTAFNIFLSRYSCQEDIVVGTPIDNRNAPELENVLGFFVNTLVLRQQLPADIHFNDLLKQVKQHCLESYAKQYLPFEQLVDALKIERNLAYHPVFQVMFVWQNASEATQLQLPGLKTSPVSIDTSFAKFDLTFEWTASPSQLECRIEYSTDLYQENTIAKMAVCFQNLLKKIVGDPEQAISKLSLLTTEEQRKILLAQNFPKKLAMTRKKIHQLFSDQAHRTPDNIALIFHDQKISYQVLEEKSTQLASLIQARYQMLNKPVTEKGIFIGLCVERSFEMIIGLLGILKAGAAYLPLDPGLPSARLKFIIEDADCPLILTQEKIKQKILKSASLAEKNRSILCLDDQTWQDNVMASASLPFLQGSADLAYLIYTSGTTGHPKGVQQTHHNVQRLLAVTQEKFNFNAHDVGVLFHSYAFDFSVWEIWASLLYGGCLVIPSQEQTRDPVLFYQLVLDQQVTVLNQTPSAFQAFMQEDQARANKISTLHYIIFGGEALKIENLAAWWEKYGDTHPCLINMYGITETTVHVTYQLLQQTDLLLQKISTIGKPLGDLSVYIVDRYLNLAPMGVPGELLIGNAGLAVGYLNRPELTHEKFIESPFLSLREKARKKLAGEEIRLYRSGDLLRSLEDGSLEYLGRIDQQVKVHGFRIELGEIEIALNKHPGIQQAVVQVIEHADIKQLVAYYVIKSSLKKKNKTPTINTLRAYLKKQLPSYMLPNRWIELDSMPLNANMKLDFKALPPYKKIDTKKISIEKITRTEALFIEIWQKVLRIAPIEVTDNFFKIGGDSMSSIRIVYAAKERNLSCSVSDIFQHQTIRELAKKCATSDEKNDLKVNQNIAAFALLQPKEREKLACDIEDAYPQSALQAGMLYHSIVSPHTAVYLDVFSYYVQAPYLETDFKQALDIVIQENPVLRTSFEISDFEVPIQRVHRDIVVPLTVNNLRSLNEQQQESAMDAWMEREKLSPFDHQKAPLFRIGIHLLAENKFAFDFSFHHAILDGWSVATFLTQLLKKYASLLHSEKQLNQPVIDSSYKIFVQAEQQAILSLAHKEFWKNELADFQFTQITPWFEEKQDDLMPEIPIPISDGLSKKLRLFAKKIQVSLDIVLLSAHIKLLSILSSSNDITTGVVFNGRPEIEGSEKTLGLFLNSLPFRQNLVDCSWEELILATSAKKTYIYPWRHYPLNQLYEDTGSENLFDILFYFTHFHVYKELEKENTIHIKERKFYERTNFKLVFAADINPDSLYLSCVLKYQSKIYNKVQIASLAQYYKKILEAIVTDSSLSHQKLSVLTQEEKDKILYQWNNTAVKYPKNVLFIDLFEEKVKQYPDNTAVIFSDSQLTYRQLNEKANQAAFCLHQRGIKKDRVVAVYMEPGLEVIIAILAIMKVGGVYLPLDFAYPKDRIEFVLEDTACQFIFTEKKMLASSHLSEKYSPFFIFLGEDAYRAEERGLLANSARTSTPSDLAYIIYTSGSTGKPKGVMIEQHSLVNFLFFMREKIELHPKDSFLALTSISFDISIVELLLPLTVGACCVLGDKRMAKDPRKIVQAIETYNISIMQATPTTWRMLFDDAWQNLSGVKILSGGEALPKDLAKKMLKYSLSAWNLYGPTEATIWASLCPLIEAETYLNPYPIGLPIANTKLLILNKNWQLSPIAVAGELYIGGTGIARAYLNKPELTKKVFLNSLFLNTKNPELRKFSSGTSSWYKTGDLVQWLPSGHIQYLGRIDDQIKIRGYRIELGEIEYVLLQHEKIKQCAVITHKNKEQEQLTAYIVLHPRCFFEDQKQLHNFLKKKLPHFMLPEKIIVLDHLPVNANGKVDKKQLMHQAAFELAGSHHAYRSPITPEQIHLAKIWCEILHCEKISLDDDFFDLGGNSILTLKMMLRLEKDFKISLKLQYIIEFPTLEKLSAKILLLKNNRENKMKKNTIGFTQHIPDPIIILQDKGDKTALFLIHPVGGGVFYYLPLVKELGNDRPVYGIQDPGIEAKEPLFHSLKEMARFYIQAMKRYQAVGPYCIAGSSFGANVAVEMARQLTDQGDSLAFIGLIDGIAKYPEDVIKNRDSFNNRLQSQIPYLQGELPGIDIPEVFLELHWHRQQIMDQHCIPDLSDLDLTLFKAIEIMDALKPMASDFNLWDRYYPKSLTVHEVTGDHLTLHFKPHVQAFAKILKKCLLEVERLFFHAQQKV